MTKEQNIFLAFLVASMLILSSFSCFAQASENESFLVTDIVGGKKIVDGREYEMTQEEAQAEYVEDNSSYIELRAVVSTNIKSVSIYDGTNRTISPIAHNQTNDPIQKTITGTIHIPLLSAVVSPLPLLKWLNLHDEKTTQKESDRESSSYRDSPN